MMRAMRIGGRGSSQAERGPAMERFRARRGSEIPAPRHQCICGGIVAALYRRHYWCVACGRELRPAAWAAPCDCGLCAGVRV